MEKQITQQKTKNKSNNNNVIHNNIHKFGQLDLSGKMVTSYKLRGHQSKFLETFYLNREIALTQDNLYSAWGKEIHYNTVNNFIKSALSKGWIYELKPTIGARVSNAYIDIKQPDFIKETGQLVFDKRHTYYRITSIGIKFFGQVN